jgi:undecaprenyl diphosphate synthase
VYVIVDIAAVPAHVGIIMDGNGRWAQKRNLPRTAGHKEGLTAAKAVVKEAARLGIRYVTLYTFSTENWKRAEEEVGFLMNLIMSHLRTEFEFYKENGIRILHIGDIEGLPPAVADEIENAMRETAHFDGLTVVLAINYGGRDEIVRAARKLVGSGQWAVNRKSVAPTHPALPATHYPLLTAAQFSAFFDVPELPDVDLVIRTGGEKRLSNFLLWQTAYSEFVFSDTLWPDYSPGEFSAAIAEFGKRNRRFGGVGE